jgi:hypothetical protein
MSEEKAPPPIPFIHGTTISQEYTVILRQGCLEFYHTRKGPWEKRNVPDFLLTPEETDGLHQFLTFSKPGNTSTIP